MSRSQKHRARAPKIFLCSCRRAARQPPPPILLSAICRYYRILFYPYHLSQAPPVRGKPFPRLRSRICRTNRRRSFLRVQSIRLLLLSEEPLFSLFNFYASAGFDSASSFSLFFLSFLVSFFNTSTTSRPL